MSELRELVEPLVARLRHNADDWDRANPSDQLREAADALESLSERVGKMQAVIEAARRVRKQVGHRLLSDRSRSTSVVGPSSFEEFDASLAALDAAPLQEQKWSKEAHEEWSEVAQATAALGASWRRLHGALLAYAKAKDAAPLQEKPKPKGES